MATTSTVRKPPTSVGKLKAPSKVVGTLSVTGKKASKPKVGARLLASPMAANDNHFALSSHSGDKIDDESLQVTSESLGQLVCISGVQTGVLRYFGETHFETGIWCGVEIDLAVGKNDGSVMGVRYFTCKEKFGIFAPLSKVTLVHSPCENSSLMKQNSGTTPNESSTQLAPQPDESNRPKTLPTSRTNVKPTQSESAPVAPATTPVTEDNYLATLSAKRLKKESKRGKDGHRLNQQLKKKRKLDSCQKAWSASSNAKCPTSIMSHNVDLPNLLTVKLKDEILGGGFASSPLYSPPATFKDGFTARLISSTPSAPADRAAVSRLERLRYERSNYPSTPKSSRILDAELDQVAATVDDSDASQLSPAATPCDPRQDMNLPDAFTLPQPLSSSQSTTTEVDATQEEGGVLSPSSSTKEDTSSDVLNLESFPAKRPSSISLFPGFSSEESSELGIFGVSTPELIGGDSASLALSIPTSCCSSPEVLDNESSLGLLTPSHLQDCWNSNTNDEDLYQHLRSPSVDDLEEFEEEDKTVDQDLPDQVGQAPDNFRMMSNSYSGSLHVNKNDGLGSSHLHHHHHHPMHHSLHEELSNSTKVKRDKTYTQLPTVPNLNQSSSELPLHQQQLHQHQPHHHHHAPLSFRGSGSGSGSGYCASDPFTDSDFNTESEADHDDCNGSGGVHINPTSLKHRSARVIDGALYTSHHGSGSSSLHQHLLHRQEASDGVGVGKSIDMISSSISVSVSSTSASACASEMESSGFYSDASERNPSGGSIMSESDGYRSSRHLSKSSSDCDDSVALNMGMKIMPLRPLTQSDDSMGYSTERDFGEIISGSSLCEGLSSFEAPSSLLSETLTETIRQTSIDLEESPSPDKVAIVKTYPATVEYQNERGKNTNVTNTNGDQIVPSMMTLPREGGDVCEAMEVDGFPEYGDNQEGANMMAHSTGKKEMGTLNNNGAEFAMKANGQTSPANFSGGSNSPNKDVMIVPSSSVSCSAQPRQDMNNVMSVIEPLATVSGTGESNKGIVATQTAANNKLGASQEPVVEMDLEDAGNSFAHETSDEVFRSDSLSAGSSPATSPLNATVVALNATALHGNSFDAGVNAAVLGGGGGGFACMRSQSVNCIASLTSSTSSASTVTAKSCVTTGGQHATRSKKATTFTKSGLSSKSRIPSSDAIPVLCGNTAKTKEAKTKTKGTSRNGMLTSAKDSGSSKSSRSRQGGIVTASDSSSSVATNITNSTTNVSSTTLAAEQSSVASASTTGSGSSSRRSSRVLAGNGKAASGGSGGGTSARNKTIAGSGVTKGSNTSTNSSINPTISDLNKSRSKASVHGSTRSLASVGLAPSGPSAVSKSSTSPACKKNNKWDAVMSKIAETKHKTINVKDIKSKVFNSVKSAGSGTGNVSLPASGKMMKGVKSASRTTLADRSNENDPLVPPAIHLRQHHFSSRSSTVSDSSLDDQPHRGPPPVKHRVKKDASISRRQISDLSSASDYSATQSQHSQPTCNSSNSTTMTTGGTRRPQRNSNSSTTGANGTKSSTSSAINTSTKSHVTKGAQPAESTKRKALNLSQPAPGRGVASKSKVGASTVSSQNDPSTKSHPAVKPLRDRNRLGPVGKNYASSGLDANANESEAPLLRGHGQSNGELESSGKSCTKVPGSAEPLIDPTNTSSNTSNLIISKSKSSNNRVSSNNQQNIQNSVLLQENTSLKEEVSRLTSVVSDLQEQISRLAASGEDSRKALEGCLANADTRSVALSIVAQHCDTERLEVYEQCLQQQVENNAWKQRLDEKLAELQKLQSEYEKEREESQEEIKSLIAAHEVEVDVTVRNCENKLEQMQKRHDETLAELKRSHTDELERLHESHRQELDQTIQKHKELLDEHRKQSPHDILHKEVESLQIVVEMRNEEIRVLRKDLMDYKNTLNDLQMAREYGKTLQAKIEDLEAQLEKARADKRSLQEGYQMLESNLQQTESENNRLSRCNEELHWKIKSHNLEEN